MEARFAAVVGFLLNTIIDTIDETFSIELSEEVSAPEGSKLLGTTDLVETGVLVLTIYTGVLQDRTSHFVGHWTASGD